MQPKPTKSMPTIEPTKDIPLPYTETDENQNFTNDLMVTANTVTALEELGAPLEVSDEDAFKTAELLKKALKNKDIKTINKSPAVSFGAKEFIRKYGARLAVEVADIRTAVTVKLMELADCGDPRYELKALELLGKHSDIALFTERSEVTVNYKNSNDLEGAIKDRIRRILHSNAVDVEPITPSANDLDNVLGPEKIRIIEPDPLDPEGEVIVIDEVLAKPVQDDAV